MRIAIIVGTRPDTLKIYPLWVKMKDEFETVLIDTQQGKDFSRSVYDHLKFAPDYKLDCMRKDQTWDSFLKLAVPSISLTLKEVEANYALVQGDTMTAFAGAIAAKHLNIPLIHLEAGVRSFDITYPYPEEMIRFTVDQMADILFTHTEFTRNNLKMEGVTKNVFLVGNTVVDLLKMEKLIDNGQGKKKRILVTVHRRDSFGAALLRICSAIKWIGEKYSADVEIIIPVHLNPVVSRTIYSMLGDVSSITLRPPMDYWYFLSLMKTSYFIVTDAGGVQEEAPSFGIPVLVLREKTDRQESVKAGFSKVVGTDVKTIIDGMEELLLDKKKYNSMVAARNPYGNGATSVKIIKILKRIN